MSLLAKLLPFIILIVALPVVVVLYTLDSAGALSGLGSYIFLALFLFPAIVAYVIIFVIAFHPTAYQFNPSPQPRTTATDPIVHEAIGLMIALLQDLSRGQITERRFYHQLLSQMLDRELQQYRIYFDRGYAFVFRFHNDEHYEAHIIQKVSEDDIVVEIDGLFDYYFERNGERHRTPHDYDTSEPLIRVPARIRCRVTRAGHNGLWQLAGFGENIRGSSLGLATQ